MTEEHYRCASVFTSKNILVCKDGEYFRASIANKINGQVLVGDFLSCEESYGQLYVTEIVRRRNMVGRLQSGRMQGLAANVDVVFIVTSANQDFNLARLERYYIIAKESRAKVCFVLSKIDLSEKYNELASAITNRFPNCFIEKTSIQSGEVELFAHWDEGETAVFLGSSGVGKSSLINYMLSGNVIKTKDIRENDGRGRHTTTARHMYILPNNRVVIDTPGLRSVGISAKADTLDELFPEIKELETKCKYRDCSHQREPGCAICQALDSDELDYERYLRYLKLVGAEEQREILKKGKVYQKEQLLHEYKAKGRKRRGV
ncbi:MAG TPA: ribosome small subunit-dependent GTPase A [Lachnoclostridium phytofermentans]|uniref:Small ribosomal subunit biogenesis GTPase RsgA n=1 Tax=Lachnoclostridium phytofermentans TaxID=66219 RepID=A0A3D2X5J0_9FIRM|nr:ribosome small subunit-dependent GTPase A [Lachnoclostridium sp.]HCL01598.1 ribosome small subunit-dependent GTPase A [Lachnoclostridium phytofermentans]